MSTSQNDAAMYGKEANSCPIVRAFVISSAQIPS